MVLVGEADPPAEATGPWRPSLCGSLTVCCPPPPQCQQCLHPGTRARLPTPERAVPKEEPHPQPERALLPEGLATPPGAMAGREPVLRRQPAPLPHDRAA